MRSIRILLVEDDTHKARTVARLLSRACGARGYELVLVQAPTRSEAFAAWPRSLGFDIVVSDWSFPIMPGAPPQLGAGELVVRMAAAANVPVLVVSGSPRPSTFLEQRAVRWAVTTDASRAIDEMLDVFGAL